MAYNAPKTDLGIQYMSPKVDVHQQMLAIPFFYHVTPVPSSVYVRQMAQVVYGVGSGAKPILFAVVAAEIIPILAL